MTRQSRVDRAAMTLAIKLMRAESRECAEQLDHMLADQGWHETGIFASYHMQTRSLRLMPWMTPPIWIDDIEAALREPRDDQRGNYGAARLLQRMQALGISKYHPTPVEAIEQAEAALRELSNFDNSTSDVAKPYRESVAPPPKPSVALRFPRVARAALNRAKARLSRRGC